MVILIHYFWASLGFALFSQALSWCTFGNFVKVNPLLHMYSQKSMGAHPVNRVGRLLEFRLGERSWRLYHPKLERVNF